MQKVEDPDDLLQAMTEDGCFSRKALVSNALSALRRGSSQCPRPAGGQGLFESRPQFSDAVELAAVRQREDHVPDSNTVSTLRRACAGCAVL